MNRASTVEVMVSESDMAGTTGTIGPGRDGNCQKHRERWELLETVRERWELLETQREMGTTGNTEIDRNYWKQSERDGNCWKHRERWALLETQGVRWELLETQGD